MAFSLNTRIERGAAFMELIGELDAAAAPEFRQQIESLAGEGVGQLVLLVQELSYMASAGLRALVFAKQKLGERVDLYVVGAQASIVQTLELTGMHHSVVMLERLEPDGQVLG